jgi:4-hydroxy-tetrahydrodipicolinate reductase
MEAVLPAQPDWDLEIVERHHRGKVDAPSGTALELARRARAQRGWADDALRHGREGRIGPRNDAEIGLHALRGGSWVGDHTVVLAGPGETVELRHVAQDRGAFAHGVLRAARFVADAPPGFYTLDDVVGTAHP